MQWAGLLCCCAGHCSHVVPCSAGCLYTTASKQLQNSRMPVCTLLPCMHCRLQDQLVIFMALAEGTSSMLCNKPTLHTQTAIAVVQQLLPQVHFSISTQPADANRDAASPQLYLIECRGAGLRGVSYS
eukprot:GHRQ01039575.1.p1 GENE.GHRQ01039575.1~~GHRQ01039575.1.p1  ORF type:complete len:128 (-),score=50.48 GHRQ01039575.1:424-807(-)